MLTGQRMANTAWGEKTDKGPGLPCGLQPLCWAMTQVAPNCQGLALTATAWSISQSILLPSLLLIQSKRLRMNENWFEPPLIFFFLSTSHTTHLTQVPFIVTDNNNQKRTYKYNILTHRVSNSANHKNTGCFYFLTHSLFSRKFMSVFRASTVPLIGS